MDILRVHLQEILHIQEVGRLLASKIGSDGVEYAAISAVGHGRLYHGVGVHGRVGHLRIKDQLPIRQLHCECARSVGRSQTVLQRLGGFVSLHAADVYAGYTDVGKHFIAVFDAQAPN